MRSGVSGLVSGLDHQKYLLRHVGSRFPQVAAFVAEVFVNHNPRPIDGAAVGERDWSKSEFRIADGIVNDQLACLTTAPVLNRVNSCLWFLSVNGNPDISRVASRRSRAS